MIAACQTVSIMFLHPIRHFPFLKTSTPSSTSRLHHHRSHAIHSRFLRWRLEMDRVDGLLIIDRGWRWWVAYLGWWRWCCLIVVRAGHGTNLRCRWLRAITRFEAVVVMQHQQHRAGHETNIWWWLGFWVSLICSSGFPLLLLIMINVVFVASKDGLWCEGRQGSGSNWW